VLGDILFLFFIKPKYLVCLLILYLLFEQRVMPLLYRFY